jgi:hypothetical protein
VNSGFAGAVSIGGRNTGGFVEQICLRLCFPLPQTDLAYGHGTGYAKSCEAIYDCRTYLDLGNLAIEVTRGEALTEQFDAMHLCFDAALAVIPGYVPPHCATEVL